MISLPMFRCKPDRRILYLSMDRVAVYHRQYGNCARPFLFDIAGNGLEHFKRYLQQTSIMTTCLVVDVAQEEFRQEVIPHVSASDHRAIVSRKKQRYFRDTPYVHAEIQGRQTTGRCDDIVMYSALTDPDLVRPWAELLITHRVPLAGICSPAYLMMWLLDYFPITARQKLIVSLHGINGIRQTCFLDDKVKMSRLIDLPFGNANMRALHIHSETEVMLRYLRTMGTLDNSAPLAICYLADGPIIEHLRGQTMNTKLAQHYFIDVAGVATRIGMSEKIAAPFCDQLLMYLLFERRFPNYYANPDQLHFYRRRNAGLLMHAVGMGILFTGLCWAGLKYVSGVDYKQQTDTVKRQAEYFTSVNRIARSRLPVTAATPAELRTLGDIARDLEREKTAPFDMLQLISTGMDKFPLIEVERIEWSINSGQDAVPETAGTDWTTHKNIIRNDQGFQMATMHAYINFFHGDYRAALEMINEFRAELENATQVREVNVLSLPLDTRPEASLEGNSLDVSNTARFSLRIILRSLNET